MPSRYFCQSALHVCGSDSCWFPTMKLCGESKKQEVWKEYREAVLHPVQRSTSQLLVLRVSSLLFQLCCTQRDTHLCQQVPNTPPVTPFSPTQHCNYTLRWLSLTSASMQACAGKTERVRNEWRATERDGGVNWTERGGKGRRPSSFLCKIRGCACEHIWMGWKNWCANQYKQEKLKVVAGKDVILTQQHRRTQQTQLEYISKANVRQSENNNLNSIYTCLLYAQNSSASYIWILKHLLINTCFFSDRGQLNIWWKAHVNSSS